jgi:imidazolonepropionase-like amidohydrolase
VRDGAVLVENGEIRDVLGAEASVDIGASEDTVVLDGGSTSSLMPGFIDAHVHLVCTGENAAFREVVDKDPEALEVRAIRNARVALRAGVTTVRDAGGTGDVVLRVRDRLRAVSGSGPTILSSGMPITTRGGHLHFFGMQADTREEVRDSVRTLIDAGVDVIKVMASAGIQTDGNDPFSAQYPVETLSELVGEAHGAGLRVAAHAHSIESIQSSITAGVDTVEHFTCLSRDPSEDGVVRGLAEQIASGAIYVDPTAIALDAGAADGSGLTDEQRGIMREAMRRRETALPALRSAGAKIIAGTDAGSTGVGFADFADGLALLAEILGWNAVEAIEAGTRVSAEALGIDAHVGSIERGKQADLVMVDGDPRTSLSVLAEVKHVMKSGVLVDPATSI